MTDLINEKALQAAAEARNNWNWRGRTTGEGDKRPAHTLEIVKEYTRQDLEVYLRNLPTPPIESALVAKLEAAKATAMSPGLEGFQKGYNAGIERCIAIAHEHLRSKDASQDRVEAVAKGAPYEGFEVVETKRITQ